VAVQFEFFNSCPAPPPCHTEAMPKKNSRTESPRRSDQKPASRNARPKRTSPKPLTACCKRSSVAVRHRTAASHASHRLWPSDSVAFTGAQALWDASVQLKRTFRPKMPLASCVFVSTPSLAYRRRREMLRSLGRDYPNDGRSIASFRSRLGQYKFCSTVKFLVRALPSGGIRVSGWYVVWRGQQQGLPGSQAQNAKRFLDCRWVAASTAFAEALMDSALVERRFHLVRRAGHEPAFPAAGAGVLIGPPPPVTPDEKRVAARKTILRFAVLSGPVMAGLLILL
jgi:hypothetical protein